MPSEISQTEKDKYCLIPLLSVESKKLYLLKIDSGMVVNRGWGWGNQGRVV